ncbi:MAG: hypothetical protein IJT94_03095, partial [Oscillibacter sp.]|nr:hypothetical protein [Oscillibacter sp.]
VLPHHENLLKRSQNPGIAKYCYELPPKRYESHGCAATVKKWRNIQARLPECSLEKREQGRSKNGQASREDIFPPLAGAEAPDPDAACGRMVAAAEPQEGVV